MYINKIAFLVAISKSIGMIHCMPVMNKDNKRVSDALTTIISQYNGRGFKVCTIHGDGAFDSLKDWAMNTRKVQLTVCNNSTIVQPVTLVFTILLRIIYDTIVLL